MAKPEDPGSQGRENKPVAGQPNPAGHLRGNDRPEGMTDAEWEAERDRVNRERYEQKQGRPRPEDDEAEEEPKEDKVPPVEPTA